MAWDRAGVWPRRDGPEEPDASDTTDTRETYRVTLQFDLKAHDEEDAVEAVNELLYGSDLEDWDVTDIQRKEEDTDAP